MRLIQLIALLGLMAVLSCSAAEARARASVQLGLPAQATAGEPTPFSWSASGIPHHGSLVVQRTVGTANRWRTILRLRALSGSAKLPSLYLGRYRLRLAAFSSGGRLLGLQARKLVVFGKVPFSTLITGSVYAPVGPGGHVGAGTLATATGTFSYVFEVGSFPEAIVVSKADSECRSVHMEILGPAGAGGGEVSGLTLTVVQEAADPVSVSAPLGAVAMLDASLTPGQSWALNAGTQPQGARSIYLYLNGYAVCSGTTPFVNAGT